MYKISQEHTFNGDKITVSIRLPEDLVEFYRELAESTGIPFSTILSDALDLHAQKVTKETKTRGQK